MLKWIQDKNDDINFEPLIIINTGKEATRRCKREEKIVTVVVSNKANRRMKTSASLGVSPHALMMGIAMAAFSSFTSPISPPANVLVMGPGGYRFIDYLKVGVPLTLIVLVVLMMIMPIFWPLTP